MNDKRMRRWAKPEVFFKERLVRAVLPEDWTSSQIVYAHYRTWAHCSDEKAVSMERFVTALRARCKRETQHLNGHELFPAKLLDPVATRAREDKGPVKETVRGTVRVLRDLAFVDGPMPEGSVLEWLALNDSEKRDASERGEDGPPTLIVRFKGQRRWIPADAVTRVL